MPQLGETVTEGTILKWAKGVGDTIAEDEVLVEISTDKVDTEVPSPAAGTILEILVSEGDTVTVGTPLVVIGEAGEEPSNDESEAGDDETVQPESAPEDEEPQADTRAEEDREEAEADTVAPTESEPSPDKKPTAAEVDAFFSEPDEAEQQPQLLSPVVRKLIRENDVDLSAIKGTGQAGRVTRKDVEAYIESPEGAESTRSVAPAAELAPAPEERAEPSAPKEQEEAPASAAKAASAPPTAAGSEEVELDRLRVRIAENMIKSKQTAAHVWTSVEVDFEKVERVRQAHKAEFKAAEGFSLTYLPFISRAVVDALKAYPVVNSSFYLEEKKAVFHKDVNLGIAIDLNEGGLIVGKVRNADGLRLVGIARGVKDLADKARGKGLELDDMTGTTFTITNPGPFGSFMSAAIINIPNVAILSTDTVVKRPTVITTPDGQDMIAIRHIGYLGFTWDHRAFDGSTAVLFLRRIKENLETWDWEQELA
jgi:2-oxoglutarate dehydrogenase E2 component (dihydrolipoamide succinyltransferase)